MSYSRVKYVVKLGQTAGCINSCIWRSSLPSSHLLNKKLHSAKRNERYYSTGNVVNDIPFFDNVKDKIKLQLKKHKLKASGYYLYECVADQLDYKSFIEELNLEDTFNSWFMVTELHVWMLMSRLMADPQYGRFTRNSIVEALWKDVSTRAKKLGPEHLSVINSQIKELSEEFQAALVNYDEGLLSGDTVLAGALWRRLFNRETTPRQLEAMVKYVRQTMFLLDRLGTEEFFIERRIKWLPIKDVIKSLPK